MTNDLSSSTPFQQRMFEKIRESLGDLMTEDELKKVVDASVKRAFFEPKVAGRDYYGKETTGEPVFVELIRKELDARIKTLLDAWLAAHEAEVKKVIDDAIAKGVFGLMQQYVEGVVAQPLYEFGERLKQSGLVPNNPARGY